MGLGVLVLGATGRFGAICDVLLAKGHRVRAMTRNPSTLEAARLESQGAEIVVGDFDDPPSLANAMTGADVAIGSGTMHRVGPEGELRHGMNLADAVAEAGLPFLVFISGADAKPGTGVPVFEVKAAVERSLSSSGVVKTILAPTYFMENLFNPWNLGSLRSGRLPTFVDPDRPIQQTAIADVIALAVLALENPDRFVGKRIEVASSEVTARQAAETLTRVTGRRYDVEVAAAASLGPGLAALFGWLDRTGHAVDVMSVHAQYPEVGWHSFEDWARLQDAAGAL